MSLTCAQRKALQCIVDHDGEVGAGSFAVLMGYGRPNCAFHMKGQVGASVLKRLQKLGYVRVWDDWIRTGGYVTCAAITPTGRKMLAKDQPEDIEAAKKKAEAPKDNRLCESDPTSILDGSYTLEAGKPLEEE